MNGDDGSDKEKYRANVALTVDIVERPKGARAASETRSGTSKPEKYPNKWPAISAIATIVYAFFSLLLWLATREAVNASRSANQLAAHNVEISERAWLLTVNWPHVDLGDSTRGETLRLSIHNTGRTPATNVYSSINGREIIAFPEHPEYGAELTGQGVVGPGQMVNAQSQIKKDIPDGSFGNILSGKTSYFLYGYVLYWDEFSIPRGLLFCGRWDRASHDFVFCDTHNVPW